MSPKSKKYRITTETREVIVVRRHQRRSAFGTCPVCQRVGEFLTLETAAELLQMRQLDVIRRLDENAVHAFETPEGQLLFCRGVEGWPDIGMSRSVVASHGNKYENRKDQYEDHS